MRWSPMVSHHSSKLPKKATLLLFTCFYPMIVNDSDSLLVKDKIASSGKLGSDFWRAQINVATNEANRVALMVAA